MKDIKLGEFCKVNLQKSFGEFMCGVKKLFSMENFSAYLNYTISEANDTLDMNNTLGEPLETIIMLATDTLRKEDTITSTTTLKDELSKVSSALSFEKESKVNLPRVYEVDTGEFYNLFNYAFYGACIVDSKVCKCFERSFYLEKNKIAVGNAGYSEKLGRKLPYYFTHLPDTKKLIFIDPIKGEVETITCFEPISFIFILGDEIRAGGTPIARVNPDGSIHFHRAFDIVNRDYKKAERQAERNKGNKRKETPWQTVDLGKLRDSNTYIRVHSLIALMVFGIDCCRFAQMEANSVFTIDHIDSKHDHNSIDNLALLTRKANNCKGDKVDEKAGFQFDFFRYMRPDMFMI